MDEKANEIDLTLTPLQDISWSPFLVDYLVAREGPAPVTAPLYDYVLAEGGVYLRSKRPDLSVTFRLAACTVRGLAEVTEFFEWHHELVPREMVEEMLRLARVDALADREVLFHLCVIKEHCGYYCSEEHGHVDHQSEEWELVVPAQVQKATACRPLETDADSSHAKALIEVHSHHSMPAFFSGDDNKDEKGFRIYAVLGEVLTDPAIRVRVGVHGYFWEIPAQWVFELPDDLKCCVKGGDEDD